MIIPEKLGASNPWHGLNGEAELCGMTLAEGFSVTQCPKYILRLAGLLPILGLPPEAAWHIAKRLDDRFGPSMRHEILTATKYINSNRKPSDEMIDELEEKERMAKYVRAYAQLKRRTRKNERKGGYVYNLAEVISCLIGYTPTNLEDTGIKPVFYANGLEIVKAFERLLDNALKKYVCEASVK